MNIKTIQLQRKRQKEIEAKHQKEIDKLKNTIENIKKQAKVQEDRHRKECYDIMEMIRQKYTYMHNKPFEFTESPSYDMVYQGDRFHNPNILRWDYNVDINFLKTIDSKIIMEEFLNTICHDIMHQWSRRT